MPLRNRSFNPVGNRQFKRATQLVASVGVDGSVEFEAQRSTRNKTSHKGVCRDDRPARRATRDRYGLDRGIRREIWATLTTARAACLRGASDDRVAGSFLVLLGLLANNAVH